MICILLAVLVALTQTGMVVACGDLCNAFGSNQAPQTSKSCCVTKCHKAKKACNCPEVVSQDSMDAVLHQAAVPTLPVLLAIPSPAISYDSSDHACEPQMVPIYNHGPPGLPPPSDLLGRAPPVA